MENAQSSNPFAKALWQCVPTVIALVGVLISLIPLGLVSHWLVFPVLALTAVYFWAINQPTLLPPVLVFVIGLAQDLLSGGPIGLWAFVYLVAYAAILSQRNLLFALPFVMLWGGFLIVAMGAGVLVWMVGSFYYSQVLSFSPIALQVAATALIYPLMSKIFSHVQTNINVVS